MVNLGLVSISFRSHSVEAILAAMKAARLTHVEWGGDVHVPMGDLFRAGEVRRMTEAAGITVAAYGSYYRLGEEKNDEKGREAVLTTAEKLGTTLVRIWGGARSSADLTESDRDALIAEARVFAAMAEKRGVTLALECHGNSVTDEYHYGIDFIRAVGSPALRSFWQPNQMYDHAYNIEAAKAYLPYAEHLHVFSWEGGKKYPLAYHEDRWRDYFTVFGAKNFNAMLEFMHDGNIESLVPTADALRRIVGLAGVDQGE